MLSSNLLEASLLSQTKPHLNLAMSLVCDLFTFRTLYKSHFLIVSYTIVANIYKRFIQIQIGICLNFLKANVFHFLHWHTKNGGKK